MSYVDEPTTLASTIKRTITSELIKVLLEPDGWARAAVMDRLDQDEIPLAWRGGDTPITASELASAAVELAREMVQAGRAEPDGSACGVALASGLVCGHGEAEHRDEDCLGCLVDLGWELPHTFHGDPNFCYLDAEVYLGGDGRFHLLEDCALDSAHRLEEAELEHPSVVATSVAAACGFGRCPDCGRSYAGRPRALRLRVALALSSSLA